MNQNQNITQSGVNNFGAVLSRLLLVLYRMSCSIGAQHALCNWNSAATPAHQLQQMSFQMIYPSE